MQDGYEYILNENVYKDVTKFLLQNVVAGAAADAITNFDFHNVKF
jgi:hypothetical protein